MVEVGSGCSSGSGGRKDDGAGFPKTRKSGSCLPGTSRAADG